jgi:potassium voltage-gated channel Eag-related subfamily H protein 6
MCLAIYNAFTIPFNIAFNPAYAVSPGMIAFDFMIDLLFMADIVLNFRTSFLNTKTGDEIKDPKKIAKSYIFGGRFILDLLSSFPIDFIAGAAGNSDGSLAIFGMLKLFRIFRLSNIIMFMRVQEGLKGMLKLF